jgi:hypothetical protein
MAPKQEFKDDFGKHWLLQTFGNIKV